MKLTKNELEATFKAVRQAEKKIKNRNARRDLLVDVLCKLQVEYSKQGY